jgi:hypothetical protein
MEGLAMEDVGIFYGHLVHFTDFCYILWTFGIVCGNLIYFSRFGILYEEKSGNPEQKTKIYHETILTTAAFTNSTLARVASGRSRRLERF